jgi:hypothetical protein
MLTGPFALGVLATGERHDEAARCRCCQQPAAERVVDELLDEVKWSAAVLSDLLRCRPRGYGQRDAALVGESCALGCDPCRGAEHVDEIALLDSQSADEGIDLLVAGIRGAGAVENVCDRPSRLLDAVLLASERAVRGQRAVIGGDPQRELAAPIGQRALRALKRGEQVELLDISDPLQVLLDGVKRVADVKLCSARSVRVDETRRSRRASVAANSSASKSSRLTSAECSTSCACAAARATRAHCPGGG